MCELTPVYRRPLPTFIPVYFKQIETHCGRWFITASPFHCPPACKPSTACQCCRPLSLYFPGSVRRVFLPRTQRKHAGLWSGEPGTKPYLFIKQRVGSGRKWWLRGCWMGSGVGHPRGSPALRLSGKGRIPMRKIMCPCECQSSVSRWWESMFSVSSRHNKPD